LGARLDELRQDVIERLESGMRQSASAALAAQGYEKSEIVYDRRIDLRLEGQDASLSIGTNGVFDPHSLRAAFIDTYRATYGYAPRDVVEAVSIRLEARGKPSSAFDFRSLRNAEEHSRTPECSRSVFVNGSLQEVRVVSRAAVARAHPGPLIIESHDTTIVVPSRASVDATDSGALVVTLSEPA
jgi:N-methylhydantoinase A